MLMGQYQNTIDAKYRLTIPAKLREELGYKCVLTKGIDECLYIYPMEEWNEFIKQLRELPLSDKDARRFSRHFNASAQALELDKQGRILIPEDHRKYANIAKDIVTIGDMNRIEVWSKENWDDEDINEPMAPSELAEKMKVYGI